MRVASLALVALAFTLASARTALAQDITRSGGYTLFRQAPSDQLRELCTDRPAKSTSPCTVDAGHIQIEADLLSRTVDYSGGVRTTTQVYGNPTVKLGLTDQWDIEANIMPYERIAVRDHGATTTVSGVGDLYLKAKRNLVTKADAALDLGLAPYLKLPTARAGLGDGVVEGGLIVPVSLALPRSWSLVIDPEVDILENTSRLGQHANFAGLVSLSKAVRPGVVVSVELWSGVNWDPAGHVTQASADLGAAWTPKPTPNLQFDAGLNLGLNSVTPNVQGYFGLSHRF